MLENLAMREEIGALVEAIRGDLNETIANLMKLDSDEMQVDKNLGEFGFDSISLTEFATLLNKRYRVQILPSVFYTCTDISSLADYLVGEYQTEMVAYFGSPSVGRQSEEADVQADATQSDNKPAGSAVTDQRPTNDQIGDTGNASRAEEPRRKISPAAQTTGHVAVIGISGIFPDSPDLDAYWDNLSGEVDMIREVPESRWNWREFFGDPGTEKNKMRSKWGGFINGVEQFDPDFFGISPREADLMDPQHRLFLLTVWRAIENAGYQAKALSGRSVGVFAGVQFNDYQTLLAAHDEWSERATTGCAPTMLVNRVSYLLNFRGPCETVNTACSSSLVAVHRAVNAVRSGEVEMALAGGVGLMLSPYNMLSAGVLDILSPEGRCKTFDASADGYVKGEGVGVVLLKSLDKAIEDGDHIHAVIRGSSVNHGGHAVSLTAPNPKAQAELIGDAVRQADIDVETISFIETHGTGTKLGDPVEIDGLKEAFKTLSATRDKGTDNTQYCGLGAVKANIGHLEPAAGIAGLLKVILALRHRTLPGTPHLKELNPYIQLDKSPFYVVKNTQRWTELLDKNGQPIPRRAGISSFGFGGTNAHVILEEAPTPRTRQFEQEGKGYLFVLSARDAERLNAQANGLLTHLRKILAPTQRRTVDHGVLCDATLAQLKVFLADILGVEVVDVSAGESFLSLGMDIVQLSQFCDRVNANYGTQFHDQLLLSLDTLKAVQQYLCSRHESQVADAHPESVRLVTDEDGTEFPIPLADIAYTLQVGRNAMAERLAFVASSVSELVSKLEDYVEARNNKGVIIGRVVGSNVSVSLLQGDEDGALLIENWLRKGKILHLAKLWVEGFELDWQLLYPDENPRRVPLPTYPFDLKPYWINRTERAPVQIGAAKQALANSADGASGRNWSIDAIEQEITRVWSEALGSDRIHRDDDFVALGGDSILSYRIINQLEKSFGVKLQPGRFMEASTIAAVSRIVAAEVLPGRAPALPQITSVPRTPLLVAVAEPVSVTIPKRTSSSSAPLSSGQERFWFLTKMFPNNSAYNVPAALRVKGDLDISLFERAYTQLIARHEALRTIFREHSGVPVQEIQAPFAGQVETLDLQFQSESAVGDHLRAWLLEPFELTQCPLMRLGVARLGPNDHVVKVVMHHIISDVWSVGIVLRELLTLYGALVDGNTGSVLPEQNVHFGDYAEWQKGNLAEVVSRQLPHWKAHLNDAPELLPLPLDNPRPEVQTFSAGHADFTVPADVVAGLKALSHKHRASLYVVVLAGFNVLLSRISGVDDIMVGTPAANRGLPETENMVGFLANTMVLRNDLSNNPNIGELIERVRASTFAAYDHQQVPFSKVVEAIKPKRATNYNPLFQVMFNMFPPMIPEGAGTLAFEQYDVTPDVSDYDLMLRIGELGNILGGGLDYNSDLFQTHTISAIIEAWLGILKQMAKQPELRLKDIQIPAVLVERVVPQSRKAQKQKLFVTATFVAEPVQETLDFWMSHLDMPSNVEFAQYNQVFPQLLDANQTLRRNRNGVNMVLVRLQDWIRFTDNTAAHEQMETLAKTVDDFIQALRGASLDTGAPIVVTICPSSVAAHQARDYQRLEAKIVSELTGWSGIYVRTHEQVLAAYPVDEIFDSRADEQGHVPFTQDYYSALASLLARTVFALRSKPHKVIVLDCDNTLWRGVIGEDGIQGIQVDPARRKFQQLLVEQQKAGVLLCLCSKNEEQDVLAVLDNHPGMLLRRQHIVSYRVNWKAKPINLDALASELNLGRDSFIFIDDNPVECGEMRAHYPEVLTLQFPHEPEHIENFLQNVWAFDRLVMTEEDEKRTDMYRQNVRRDNAKRAIGSFADFLASLALKIDIQPMTLENLPRVSQLTYRTNQFNFTGLRRSELEIQQLLQQDGYECLTASVSDRFGDYGLVGAMIFAVQGADLVVDSLLLSCRVLSKGVEHRMVARLGEIARERGLYRVVLCFRPSPRNTPAQDFLSGLTSAIPRSDGKQQQYVLTAESAASLIFIASDQVTDRQKSPAASAPVEAFATGARLAEIAQSLFEVSAIRNAVHSVAVPSKVSSSKGQGGTPRSLLEQNIANAICESLGMNNVGTEDNFFDLGAHSSVLVQVAGKLEAQMGQELPVIKFFQYPTVGALARHLSADNSEPTAGRKSRRRGEKQRQLLMQLRQSQAAEA